MRGAAARPDDPSPPDARRRPASLSPSPPTVKPPNSPKGRTVAAFKSETSWASPQSADDFEENLPAMVHASTTRSDGRPLGDRRSSLSGRLQQASPAAALHGANRLITSSSGRPASRANGPESPSRPPSRAQVLAAAGRRWPGGRGSHDDMEVEEAEGKAQGFAGKLEELGREHEQEVSMLRQQNEELKNKLNAVLSAQWKFQGESWQGESRDGRVGELHLLSGAPSPKESSNGHMWSVSRQQMEDMDAPLGQDVKKFRTRHIWLEQADTVSPASPFNHKTTTEHEVVEASERSKSKIEGQTDKGLGRWIMHPYNSRRLMWDLGGLCLLCYDLVMVPLGAFEPTYTIFLVMMDWLTLIFWTLDMFVGAFTGYEVREGLIIMDPKKAVRHYMRSRLVTDLLVIVPDWFFTIFMLASHEESDMAGDNVSKFIRTGRLIRIYRLMRIAKLRRMWLRMKDRVNSEVVFYLPGIAQVIVLMLLSCHIIASLWYVIGSVGPDNNNWVDNYRVEHADISYRYFVSLQWAISRFTLTSAILEPQNSGECAFSVIVSMIGTVMFLWSVGSITQSFILARSLDSEASKEFWLLRRYLRQHHCPAALSFRILSYAEAVCKPQVELIPQDKVRVITFLSEQLKCELDFSVNYAGLLIHPVMSQILGEPGIIQGLVYSGLKLRMLAARDMVFTSGAIAKGMYMIVTGEVDYKYRGSRTHQRGGEGDWLSEAALWCPWTHRGDCMAIQDTKMIAIDHNAFGEVIAKEPMQMSRLALYAEWFCNRLNTAPEQAAKDIITDLSKGEAAKEQVAELLELANRGESVKKGKEDRRGRASRQKQEDGPARDLSTN